MVSEGGCALLGYTVPMAGPGLPLGAPRDLRFTAVGKIL